MEKINHNLSHNLKIILKELEKNAFTLRQAIDLLGHRSFGLVIGLLSIPSALPIPAPGYSTPFGIAIALISTQIIIGRESLWLPKKILNIKLSQKLLNKPLKFSISFLSKIEQLTKHRLQALNSELILKFIATLSLFLAILMILPIPMTNTFPAMVIFLISISISQNDGLLKIISLIIGIIAILLYSYIIFTIINYGIDGYEYIKTQT